MRNNGYYAINSVPSPSLLIDSNLIADNKGGIYLYGKTSARIFNSIIVRSNDAIRGSGIEVAAGASARIVNNTIWGNARYGVVRTMGTVSVVNSIVTGNAGGNILGVEPGAIESSLISGDPGFVNPGRDDFSLVEGSPAIDGGSIVNDLPFVDFYGHLRVASVTSPPGEHFVDIGAIEANSGFPLIFPVVANGEQISFDGSLTTGIAISNPGTDAANVVIVARDENGYQKLAGSRNPAQLQIDPGAQKAILAYELFGFDPDDSQLGSALGAGNSDLSGFFLICDARFRYFCSGANAFSQGAKEIIFPRHESGSTSTTNYVINNPGINTAILTATLFDVSRTPVESKTINIGSRGQAVLRFASGAASSGYMSVKSDLPVVGVEFIGKYNILSALSGLTPDSGVQLFFPHYAVGGNYQTQIGVVNSTEATVSLTLAAHDSGGNLIAGPQSFSLPARGRLIMSVSDLFGIPYATSTINTGYIVAHADRPGLVGFAAFSYSDGTRYADTAIPADTNPQTRLVFSHIAQGIPAGSGVPYQTGIALLNPFGAPVEYTMRVFDGSGNLMAQTSDILGPHQKVARILSHPMEGAAFFRQPIVLGNGHLEVISKYGLIGYELFYTEDLSQLASVPAQTPD